MRLIIYLLMALTVVGVVHCFAHGRTTEAVVGVNTAIILWFVLRIEKKQRDEY